MSTTLSVETIKFMLLLRFSLLDLLGYFLPFTLALIQSLGIKCGKILENILDNYKETWIVGGDFNYVFKDNEKLGGRPINHKRAVQL